MDNLAEQLYLQTRNKSKLSVYLQTSKGIYETGEDLWFKGYVLNAQNLLPSVLDRTLFVQLEREDNDQVVLQEKYQIENGFVEGHIYIQDSLQAGDYRLIAYSSHSFNDGPEEFHTLRKLKIVRNIKDTKKKTSLDTIISKTTEQSRKSIHFNVFPEGGYLVSGLESTLAFKAVDRIGNPLKVSGTLFEDNNPIQDFKSVHVGMGSFRFIPDADKKYHIQLNGSLNVNNVQYPLPKVRYNGIVMQLEEKNDKILTFKIAQSKGVVPQRIYFRTQIRGMVQNIASAVLKDSLIIKLPIKDVPQGIAEVTLFNKDLMPVAERLVYINPNKKLHIKTELLKGSYAVRDKVFLKLITTDENGAPVPTHLGISVFDKLYQNKGDTKDIITHYHLSTQLKGRMDNPGYYFDETSRNREAGLDLLLLTQGWRRYVWNEQNLKAQKTLNRLSVKDNVEGKLTYIKKGKGTPRQSLVMIYTPLEEAKKM